MTKRRAAAACTFLLLTIFALVSAAPAESCLWKVSSDEGFFYLQGSVHFLKSDNYPLDPAIEQAYASSRTIVLEADIGEMASSAAQQRIMQMALLPGTNTLKQALSDTTYQRLSEACRKSNIPPIALDKFKPWFAAMTLTLVRLQNMGFAPQYGLDHYFYNRAKADEKKIEGLESIDFQLRLLDSLSAVSPDDVITRALDDLTLIERDITRLETAWKEGDIKTLDALMAQSFRDYPELHKTFVLDRNRRWIKTLKQLPERNEPCMVVVGAGHLSGEGGLLQLLIKEGFAVEQL